MLVYNTFCCHDSGLSPNGKALDSDSSIWGFESLKPSYPRIYARVFVLYKYINYLRIEENAYNSYCTEMRITDHDRIRKRTVPECC